MRRLLTSCRVLTPMVALCLIVPLYATTLLQDSFTDTNGTALEFHTPTPSGGFTWVKENGGVITQIQSNMANGASAPGGTVNIYYADAAQADVVITLDCVVPSGNFFCGVTGRGTASSDIWLFGIEDDLVGAQDYIVIYEYTGGTQTIRASANITSVQSSTVTMTVTLNGSSLRLQAGTGDINYSSSVRVTNTNMGIFTYRAATYTTAPLDNFLITTIGGGGGTLPCFRSLLGVGCH